MSRADAASGARDRQVTIQQLTASTGGSGYPVETWADLRMVWAHKRDLSVGAERFIANQEVASYNTVWTLPYVADMDPELVDVPKSRRLLVHGRVHDIVAAVEVGRREGIELRTVAGGLLV